MVFNRQDLLGRRRKKLEPLHVSSTDITRARASLGGAVNEEERMTGTLLFPAPALLTQLKNILPRKNGGWKRQRRNRLGLGLHRAWGRASTEPRTETVSFTGRKRSDGKNGNGNLL